MMDRLFGTAPPIVGYAVMGMRRSRSVFQVIKGSDECLQCCG